MRKACIAPASINRLMNAVRAALTFACPERTHIWRAGFSGCQCRAELQQAVRPGPMPRSAPSSPSAYARDAKLGLLCEVLSETGMRPVQAARLKVGYLIAHPSAPRLLVSKSAKGGGRNRTEKKRETYALPISAALAHKLKPPPQAARRMTGYCCAPTGRRGTRRTSMATTASPSPRSKALGLNPKISGLLLPPFLDHPAN